MSLKFLRALACASLLLASAVGLRAATSTWPTMVNYQGQLTDLSGAAVADGPYTMKFSLYNVASNGTAMWTETQTVNVTKGLFNAVLGSTTSLASVPLSAFNSDLWVGLSVGADQEMSPRQQLLPSAYAKSAQSLGGLLPNNTANNLVVLDATGKLPAGLVQGGSISAPLDLAGSSSYVLSLANASVSSAALGLSVTAANGVLAMASDPAGYGIWGQSAPSDTAAAVGVRGSAGAGIGVLAQSLSGLGLSVTTQSATKPAFFAAGANPARLLLNTSGSGNIGLAITTPNDDQDVNLVDRANKAGVWANVSAASTYGVSATAAAGTGVYGATGSNSATDYGVWGSNLGGLGAGIFGSSGSLGSYGVSGVNSVGTAVLGVGVTGVAGSSASAAGAGVIGYNSAVGTGATSSIGTAVGVQGQGYIGVQGLANQPNGAIGVLGINSNLTGTATVGRHLGTGAGQGVRGSSPNGVGAIGVYGTVSAAAAVGVEGYALAPDAYGVEGIQASSDSSATGSGVYGKAFSLSSGYGVRGEGNKGIYGLSAGVCGVCGLNQSISDGSSAGYFQSLGASGVGYAVRASTASPSGVNYFSETTSSPAFGFYHEDNTGSPGRVGIYSVSNCLDCQAGIFINTAARSNPDPSSTRFGDALTVQGRIKLQGSAGTFTALTGATSYTVDTNENPYTPSDGKCLVFLTVATQTTVVAAVTAKGPGGFTVSFSAPLPANTTYQYLIIGQ